MKCALDILVDNLGFESCTELYEKFMPPIFAGELIYHYTYSTDDKLNEAISDFAYIWYNHVRPHSYNDGLTPMQKRKNYNSVYAAKAA